MEMEAGVAGRNRGTMGSGRGGQDKEGEGSRRTRRERADSSLEEGWVRVMCDAGFKEGWGVGLGVVCWDHEEGVQWTVMERRRGMAEADEAEAEAILEGVKEAARRGVKRIVVESDCKSVIDILREGLQGRSFLFLVIDEIRNVCNNFDFIIWHFLGRKDTKIAHDLAHLSNSVIGGKMWEGRIPCSSEFSYMQF
ncbi:uncharacterized protein LOC141641023 [Silene latifolia]|uniref:uncharacterized protein LOC141641023 n=1 Tax=Silene latifolia TaxID=37657 RepID=UPI003D770C8C